MKVILVYDSITVHMNTSELTFIAVKAAHKAGEILKKGFGTSFKISSKPGRQNLVTEYDKASEAAIKTIILDAFPTHAILAEESGAQGTSPVQWIVDPLDGTVNFAHNIPVFSVSIAACIDKKLVTGIVFAPLLNELFIAEAGKGSYLNDARLHVTSTSTLDNAFLATGFPYNVDENPLHCIDTFAHMTRQGIPIRRLGSAAIDLAYVAAGRFDAYWEVSLEPWDLAAGKLLVEEAGGRVSHYDGSERDLFNNKTVLASNGHLHDHMIKELEKPCH